MKLNKEVREHFEKWYDENRFNVGDLSVSINGFYRLDFFMQQGVLLEFIREERGVLIQVYNNASGYLWSMAKNVGGTDLGFSYYSGTDDSSGTFKTYNDAMETAINLELNKGGLNKFQKEFKPFHWENYAFYLLDGKI